MKNKNISIIILFLSFLTLTKCSTYEYFSINEDSYNFEGEWLLKNDPNKKLIILINENNLYSLKFYSNQGNWEAIGYQIENELLSIFKYKKLNGKGYITFKIISPDKIYYESINADGSFRSDGNYYKLKSP